jgi:hypothetical protein
MESILGYDSLNLISLNWIALMGIIIGALFTYQTFALRKWRYKTMTVIAFLAIISYLMLFYFTLDYNLPKESLMLSIFLRSFGYVVVAICFLTALCRVPFLYFFETVSVQAFVSAGLGEALGTTVLGHALKVVMKKNEMLLGANLDNVNILATRLSKGELYGALQQQALMVSMKELYGWLVLISLFCLLVFIVKESSIRPKFAIHPKFRTIRRSIKHELREKIN